MARQIESAFGTQRDGDFRDASVAAGKTRRAYCQIGQRALKHRLQIWTSANVPITYDEYRPRPRLLGQSTLKFLVPPPVKRHDRGCAERCNRPISASHETRNGDPPWRSRPDSQRGVPWRILAFCQPLGDASHFPLMNTRVSWNGEETVAQ
jgi:hypothetical protein